MNQADVTRLVSKLRIGVLQNYRRLKNPDGPEGRLMKLRRTLTALIKYERIELRYIRADESRGYVERVSKKSTNPTLHYSFFRIILYIQFPLSSQLISDAIRHGDKHKPTMEMADYWILEKQYVHKLFKVLAPRLENCPVSYTRMYRAPKKYPGDNMDCAILELRGHPFPSIIPNTSHNRNFIQNVLLDEAKKEYRRTKYAQFAEKLAPLTSEGETSEKVESGTSEDTETVPVDKSTPSNEDPKNESK